MKNPFSSFLLEKRKEGEENQVIILRYRISSPAGILLMRAQSFIQILMPLIRRLRGLPGGSGCYPETETI